LKDWGVEIQSSMNPDELDKFFESDDGQNILKDKLIKCPHCGEEFKL